MFSVKPVKKYYLSRSDVGHPLASYSKFGFVLDGAEWPSAEHYYQAMKFEQAELRESVRSADHPQAAKKLADSNRKLVRQDWKKIREVIMTRAVYIKCRSHDTVAAALLATGDQPIVESSQFDYYWGCGRDGRGDNTFGKVLMAVRDKLRQEQS